MIRIGLSYEKKQQVIEQYLSLHGIQKIKIFYPEKFPLPFQQAEHVESADIIMYKVFYRLLEEIGNDTLLVFNECLRTQKRSDLTYNCAHHYCNQTEHKIIFEHFPFIEDRQDFMILLDLQNKGRYKGKSFFWDFLRDEDVQVEPVRLSLSAISVPITDNQRQQYERKKQQLFSDLRTGDPDTIPRNLHVLAGNFKKQAIDPSLRYIARNERFKLPEVVTYKKAEVGDYIIIDFPHRCIDFNDFLKKSNITDIRYITTNLKVDWYYEDKLRAWIERLGEFYAQASIYTKERP